MPFFSEKKTVNAQFYIGISFMNENGKYFENEIKKDILD